MSHWSFTVSKKKQKLTFIISNTVNANYDLRQISKGQYLFSLIYATHISTNFISNYYYLKPKVLVLWSLSQPTWTIWASSPKKDSSQPALPCSLISVFVVHINKLCILGYPRCAQWDSDQTARMHTFLTLWFTVFCNISIVYTRVHYLWLPVSPSSTPKRRRAVSYYYYYYYYSKIPLLDHSKLRRNCCFFIIIPYSILLSSL